MTTKTLDEHEAAVAKMRGFPDDMVTDAVAAYDAERAAREKCETAIGRLLLRVRELEAERDSTETVLSDIAESLGVNGDADADLAGHLHEIDEAVPHYAIDAEGNEASSLSERVGLLVRERDEARAQLARLRELASAVLDTSATGRQYFAAIDGLRAALSEPGPTLAEIERKAAEAGAWWMKRAAREVVEVRQKGYSKSGDGDGVEACRLVLVFLDELDPPEVAAEALAHQRADEIEKEPGRA